MSLKSADALRARVTHIWPVLLAWSARHWKWLTFLIAIAIAVAMVVSRWPAIHWLVLGDTDDNIRYVQVKDWLAGQGWYDLRQYRLDPPGGANIHWSRLVDIPIAGLILFFRAFVDQGLADRLACGIAPLLPLLLLMLSLGFIGRRLAGPHGWLLAALAPLAAQMGLGMYAPMRIDHHGWQLALAVTMLAGVIDTNRLRGGVMAGVSSALSIAIGMEMIVYLAAGGGLIALRWVFREGAERRMLPYALSLGGATSLCYLLFASYANRAMVCDAISPIWVAVFGAASAGMVLLSLAPLRGWAMRLAAGAVVGGAVAAFFWLNWPQCLSPYQISPELERLWLANIREAKPITAQAQSLVVPLLAIPLAGLVGLIWALWDARRDAERLWAWATVGLMMLFSTALLFWQLRAGPAAQLLAIPPAAWAAHRLIVAIFTGTRRVRIAAGAGVALLAAIACAYPLYPQIMRGWAELTGNKPKPWRPSAIARNDAIKKANSRCRTLPALEVLDQLPPATIFTMVDLGPRLIATTHHSALAGPYHRNGATILDMHHAYDGPADAFRPIAARHHATYLLVCPNFPEGTIYQSRSPQGFYADLMRGAIPRWLVPVTLNSGMTLPYQLYRIDYSASGSKKIPEQR
ncbi:MULTISPECIES: hypothetical protein [unclassified Sphingobium]|uniref:hypothetical protein n=1 Tax=unclassified Sphingobium TaxID=2611147 RepID=UPI000D17611F|nr:MULTISPECIES: hypothetical protein [unclassified Sphingobium]MBG6119303.1 hypothetical protein [Sphingobium sp. JAI105]PSO11787.1 hypothetical protein C7E20_10040 [Sphingobium sp. AEW4]TWD01573.1 hypothetical protein FB595_116111 [Sphingobium sp. AEW010]TWD20095.1 hypothetical protein FB596_11612 [Sphingobium sp. AEW013]TWD23182.1 hypothetical protein FB594_116111 [Sphingobium sp. AEW001]